MKELKVVIGENAASTHVYVDNKPVGMIQDIKVHVGVDTPPTVEIVFPDLRPFSPDAAKKVAAQVQLVQGLPQVKVSLAKVEMTKK
jgi:hypothetical protein